MLDIRKRILIITSIVIGVLIAILLLFYVFRSGKNSSVENVSVIAPDAAVETAGEGMPLPPSPTGIIPTSPVPSTPVVTQGDPEDRYLRQLATLFVERVGSFSNQNENQHIVDVHTLVTDRVATWLTTTQVQRSTEYRGTTTQVIVSNLTSKKGDAASVHIDAQKTNDTQGKTTVTYISGRVELLKVAGVWKINGLYWE